MTDLIITLQQIRDAGPCGIHPGDHCGWALLLRNLNEPHGKPDLSRRVSIGDIAKSNGADDALWCTRLLPDEDRRAVVRMVLPAVKRASVHTDDAGVHDCIRAVERWVDGEDVDLRTVRAAADAAGAAWAAARTAGARAAAAAATWAASEALADAEAWAAEAAARAAEDAAAWARAAEQIAQIADIIAVSPLYAFEGGL